MVILFIIPHFKEESFSRFMNLIFSICFISLYTALLVQGCISNNVNQPSEQTKCIPDYSISGPFVYVNGNDSPWIHPEDIDFYDNSTHTIFLKKNKTLPFEEKGIETPPFKVTANNTICLEGKFWSIASSSLPKSPAIYYPRFYQDMVNLPMMSAENDNLQVFKNTLVSKCLFHAGIECLLDSVYVNNDSISTVIYIYTINNLDKDDLYLLDPYKIGNNSFHYFTNGVYLENTAKHIYYGSSKKNTIRPSSSDGGLTWLSMLKSHESMTRTVKLTGYENILPGTYECFFIFPSLGIAKEMRQLENGRVWEGGVRSSKITVKVMGQ
ncbi:MAG: hypothetical protein PVI26_08575 [Chitinispirillia bacterium]